MEKVTLAFSEGTLSRFQSHFGQNTRSIHGETDSANITVIKRSLSELYKKLSLYERKAVWNEDVLELVYRQRSGWSLTFIVPFVTKKDK